MVFFISDNRENGERELFSPEQSRSPFIGPAGQCVLNAMSLSQTGRVWSIGFAWGALVGILVTFFFMPALKLKPEAVVGLVGVALGAALAKALDRWDEKHERAQSKAELWQELNANLRYIPLRQRFLQRLLGYLIEGQLLPGESVPFSSVVFKQHFPRIADILTERERTLIHFIYFRLSVVDKELSKYADDVIGNASTSNDAKALLREFYINKFRDLKEGLGKTESQIKSLLAGDPIDVLSAGRDEPANS